MQKQPLVSIIIPVYNGTNFLKKAIDSALSQTYKNLEVLVINDGSNDDGATEKLALSYGEKIRYFCKENGGVSSALNFGIKQMKGEYFSWLSHDDEYTPTKIEKQIERLNAGGDIVVCSEAQINEASEIITKSNDYAMLEGRGVIKWQEIAAKILSEKIFNGCTLLVPKTVFDTVGFFNEDLRYNQDFDMWLRICFGKYSWIYNNDVGVYPRVHDNQVTQTRRDLFYTDSYKLGKELIPKLAEISDINYNFLFMYAKRCAKYKLTKNVELCVQELKNKNLYSFKKAVNLTITVLYGKLRPVIRRMYYKIFKKVKTQ